MKTVNRKEKSIKQNIQNRQSMIQYEAEKKLAAILNEPSRLEAERCFAERHRKDSDEELLLYLKAEKKRMKKRFNRRNFIGYTYILERFGSWERAVGPVNEMIRREKEERSGSAAEEGAKEKGTQKQ